MSNPPNVVITSQEVSAPAAASAAQPAPVETGKMRDARGRMLEVRALNSLETYRLMKATKATGGEGFFGMAAMAASVRSIDGHLEGFPGTEMQIESMIQRLGNEGLAAVAEALSAEKEEEQSEAPKS